MPDSPNFHPESIFQTQSIGSPQLRSFAALALAKIAVRSNEPFRIQCYSMLSSVQHMAGGDSGSGSRSGGGRDDPLGLAAVVAPALEALDAMYAGGAAQRAHH